MNNSEISNIVNDLEPIDVMAQLFKNGNYDFIVKGVNELKEHVEHKKMREAFEALTSNKYSKFLYGGGAGSGKSWCGCSWLLFMCKNYPGTRWFVARNELKDIVDSVYVTFTKVCKEYGFTDYKFNAVKNFIQFGNGSFINFIEIKYKPSDPEFQDLGSTEYTGGWIEEGGEVNEMGARVIGTRVGRHLNIKYGLKGIIFITCNPAQNWLKIDFYDKWVKGILEEEYKYLPALVTDNPFIPPDYIKSLRELAKTSTSLFQRLFKGDWNYVDSPNALVDRDALDSIFDNDHVTEGNTLLTADIATYGSDLAVIAVWKGWQLVEMKTMAISKTTDIENVIRNFRMKYRIAKTRCIADADGVGIGVVHGAGIKGFHNGARPIKEKAFKGFEMPNYRNLQVQCLYKLAEKINEGGIWISCDLSNEQKQHITQELFQIQSNNTNERKLDCKPKAQIKQDIGRSPDYRDCFVGETKVLTPNGYVRIDSIKKGDLVVTPYGNRRVVETMERDCPEKLYSVNGAICTGNHRFFTTKGLISSDTLVMNDYIYTDSIINLIIWKIERLLSTKDLNTGFQKRQNITTTQTLRSMENEKKKGFIAGYMKIIIPRFLKALTYIILMEILLTIPHTIYRLSKGEGIGRNTQNQIGKTKNTVKKVWKTLKICKRKLRHGILPKKEENGIGKTQRIQDLENTNQKREVVKIAESNIKKKQPIVNFVAIAALKNTTTKQKNTTKKENAHSEAKHSLLEKMKKHRIAHVHAVKRTKNQNKVYTLTIEKDNCYFAHGMLVENCLLMRVWFDLKAFKPKFMGSRPRTSV